VAGAEAATVIWKGTRQLPIGRNEISVDEQMLLGPAIA